MPDLTAKQWYRSRLIFCDIPLICISIFYLVNFFSNLELLNGTPYQKFVMSYMIIFSVTELCTMIIRFIAFCYGYEQNKTYYQIHNPDSVYGIITTLIGIVTFICYFIILFNSDFGALRQEYPLIALNLLLSILVMFIMICTIQKYDPRYETQ